jgi:transposase
MVARVWRKHALRPQRLDRYMSSDDPDFEKKAADIIGLYLNPPAHAAVFCVDEKTAIQALDRLDPVLPLSPGRAERHGFEYKRHGTLSLYVIADNLSAHKTELVETFLAQHPKVNLHFTPTYSSWLNQVELWFAKIERDVIARGIFTSVTDLKRKLMRYIRNYNAAPRTVKWKYFNPSHRIDPSTSAVTVH